MRILAIFKRILLQRRGDKRSLALLFLAPLLILGLMYFLLQIPTNQTYRVGLVNKTSMAELTTALKKSEKLNIISVNDNSRATMNEKNLSAIVEIKAASIDLTFSNKDSGTTQIINQLVSLIAQKRAAQDSQSKIQSALEEIFQEIRSENPQLAEKISSLNLLAGTSLKITSHYLYGNSKLSPFDNLAPVLLSFFVFLFVFLISGISLVNERSSGTLIRMLVTPVKRREIVAGYTLAFGLLALIQTGLILLWAKFVLQMAVLGSFVWVFVINLLIALIALLIGLLFSALSQTEFQFIQFVPIAIVPQFLFSGIINVDTMSQPLQCLAHIMPLYYGVDALQRVIKQGEGFSEISLDLLILLGVVILLYLANVVALKNLRRT